MTKIDKLINKYNKAIEDLCKVPVDIGNEDGYKYYLADMDGYYDTNPSADISACWELLIRFEGIIRALKEYDHTPKYDGDVAEDCVSRIKRITGYEEY